MAVIKNLKAVKIDQDHLLGIQDISFSQVSDILKQAKTFISLNRSSSKKNGYIERKKLKLIYFLNLQQELKVLLNWQEKDWEQM